MYLCFICKSIGYAKTTQLISHYKFVHGYTATSTYICYQNNCLKRFTEKKRFYRHLIQVHRSDRADIVFGNSENSLDECLSVGNESNFIETVLHNASIDEDFEIKTSENYATIRNDNQLLKNLLSTDINSFLSEFHSNYSLPRSVIQKIVSQVEILFKGQFFEHFKTTLISNANGNEEACSEIENTFALLSEPFSELRTEYNRMKILTESGFYIPPQPAVFGFEKRFIRVKNIGPKRIQNNVLRPVSYSLKNVPITGQYIPISPVLKKLLETPGNLSMVKFFLSDLEESPRLLQHFCQGELWKNVKKLFGNKFVLPLFFYNDDFNVDNVQGSHSSSNKLSATYYTVPFFPQKYLHDLQLIFIALIFNAEHRKTYPIKVLFREVLNELSVLENEGLIITVDGKSETVYFAMPLFLGDNLGVHAALGFTEGFRANYPCRGCKIHKLDLQSCFRELQELLRNRSNYACDLALNDLSMTGIASECAFNILKSFHAAENVTFDLMHDLPLGILRVDVPLLLNELIKTTPLTLDILNTRITGTDYGVDAKDKPPKISENHLTKNCITIYASEMFCLVKYLPIMVEDFVPEELPAWKWFLLMRKLLDILLSKSIQIETVLEVEDLVTLYLEMRLQLFPLETLKPKHHYLVHYASALLVVGPLVNVWCMRFEANHRLSIAYARNCQSRVNIEMSLCIKHQMILAHYFMRNKSLHLPTEYGPLQQKSPVTFTGYNNHLLKLFRQTGINVNAEQTIVPWLKDDGLYYAEGLFVINSVDAILPQFMQIFHILVLGNINYLICKLWTTVSFNNHLHAYNIEPNDLWNVTATSELLKYKSLHRIISYKDGKSYVVCYT